MSFPYLDLAGFARRTSMPASEVAYVEQDSPGFIAARIAVRSSYINGRLRKRYGNSGSRSSLPLGQTAPELLGSGTAPPSITLTGRPVLGSIQLQLSITTGGATGVAVFSWTADGVTTHSGVVSGPAVSLTGTGMIAAFSSSGIYSTDNVYSAATPVPEIVLGWLTLFVTYDAYRRRGVNPQDPLITLLVDDMNRALDEIKEAADSKDGLFDLPVSDDEDSAITTGGPLAYSEVSPYVWTDIEAAQGSTQDAQSTSCGRIVE